MKCANCSRDALYVYDPPSLVPTPYCGEHLPAFLRPRAKSGALTRTSAFDDQQKAALATLAPRTEPAPEEAAVEPVEEAQVPAEAPKRKPRAKKAVPKTDEVAEEAPTEPAEG